MSAASDQKLFCKLCSPFCCSFDEFVEGKVISSSYSSAILTPPDFRFIGSLHPHNSLGYRWDWVTYSWSVFIGGRAGIQTLEGWLRVCTLHHHIVSPGDTEVEGSPTDVIGTYVGPGWWRALSAWFLELKSYPLAKHSCLQEFATRSGLWKNHLGSCDDEQGQKDLEAGLRLLQLSRSDWWGLKDRSRELERSKRFKSYLRSKMTRIRRAVGYCTVGSVVTRIVGARGL